jgi:hypothetical protein
VRDRILKLAALAANESTPEHEAKSAALILAKLIHAKPELVGASSAPLPAAAGAELDPLVGAVVREAVAAAGDLFRDFFERKADRARASAPRPANVQRCPICQAAVIGPPALAGVRTCGNGHRWTSVPPRPSSPPDPPKPGPRKARAARARRA